MTRLHNEAVRMELAGPNPTMLEILKLYLERLPIMTEEERMVFLSVVRYLAYPVRLITPDVG